MIETWMVVSLIVLVILSIPGTILSVFLTGFIVAELINERKGG